MTLSPSKLSTITDKHLRVLCEKNKHEKILQKCKLEASNKKLKTVKTSSLLF